MSQDTDDFGIRQFATSPVTVIRQHVLGDDLLAHGSIIAIATVASGALNYAFQVFMGRALGPEQYGVFGALFALFYIVNVFGRGIRFSATRFTAELVDDGPALASFHRKFLRQSMLFSIGIFVTLVAAAPILSDFLDVSPTLLVVAIAGTAPFGLALTVNFGTLQGVQWFTPLGGYKVLLAGVKLAAGVVLVLLGYGVFGAFTALVLASVVVFGLTTLHVRRRLPDTIPSTSSFDFSRAYRYTLPAILTGFCVTVPTTVDVLLAKAFFPSRLAGLYVAASVLGKILIFLPMGISTALFPKVSTQRGDETATNALLNRAMLYTAVIAGLGAVTYWVVPEFVLTTFYGAAYADAVPLLQWYGISILAFALASVVLNFELARSRNRFVYVFTLISVVEIALMGVFHASPLQFLHILLAGNATLVVLGIIEVHS
ncbi:oligosaccharide flippase family protein [Haloferax namakaokahaiae]|uniref:Oligosaccharide flippase family protein n=1 Tax=Haloferax namakaokahaiae TaxID=1748331 RepID=A0ABD5ZCU1_9EURY